MEQERPYTETEPETVAETVETVAETVETAAETPETPAEAAAPKQPRESFFRRQRPEPLPVDQAYGCGVVPRRQRAFHGTYGGHVLLRAEAQRRYHVVGAPPDRYFTSHRSFHLR